MGFGSVMAMPDTYPIQKLIREYRIGGDGPPLPSHSPATEEWLQRLGSLPLMAQPGERWMYHVSFDVLGVLIARVSGQSLGTFMRERIFDPLGMKDTAFHVPAEKIDRLPGSYFFNRQTNALDLFDDAANSAWRTEPPFESGGGGLVSTIDDYFAFSRMMLNKGRHGREQILSRAAVELMTSDQLTPEQRAGSEIFFGSHSQLGLRDGGGNPPQRNLPHAGPIRLGRRLRHVGLHRSRRGDDRHPLHAAHDGFAGAAEGIHRLLDAGVWSDGMMAVYVALLRAVNVGGTGKLSMSDLKELCERAGFSKVRTYIASGNVVFESRMTEAQVKTALETALAAYAGKPVGVLMRTAAEMAEVLASNPFPDAPPNRTVAIFLDESPPSDSLERITGRDDEEVRLGKREIYVRYGENMGRSKLKIPAAKAGTARNINTVSKLVDMAAEL